MGSRTPLEDHKIIDFLRNNGMDSKQPNKPSSALQQKVIEMAFCWRMDGGPLYLMGKDFLRITGMDHLLSSP